MTKNQQSQTTSRRAFLAHSSRVIATAGGAMLGLASGLGTEAQAQTPASADAWHLLCSGPPGSIPDIVARRVAEQLGGQHGQKVIVDNRAGAAGLLAVAALKAAPTDGATLLLAQGAIATVYPHLYPKLNYDPVLDLAPASLAGERSLALAVGAGGRPCRTCLREQYQRPSGLDAQQPATCQRGLARHRHAAAPAGRDADA